MKYPTLDKKAEQKRLKEEQYDKEIELYCESDTWEEFELNRTLAGYHRKYKLFDPLWINYIMTDKKWLHALISVTIVACLLVFGFLCIYVACLCDSEIFYLFGIFMSVLTPFVAISYTLGINYMMRQIKHRIRLYIEKKERTSANTSTLTSLSSAWSYSIPSYSLSNLSISKSHSINTTNWDVAN